MDNIRFEWDEAKATINVVKHRITFETAIRVFADPHHVTTQDRIEGGEYRWQTVGFVSGYSVLLIAHSWIEEGGVEVVRLVSARRATRTERKRYHGQDRDL